MYKQLGVTIERNHKRLDYLLFIEPISKLNIKGRTYPTNVVRI